MKAKVSFDGGCRPTNPGYAGIGVVVKIDGEKYRLNRYIGRKSNNYAEYTGLIVGIKYAKELGASEIEIVSDSQLVVKQIAGEYKCREKSLIPLHREAKKLLERLFPESWELVWKKRKHNGEADELSTKAIFWGRSQNPFYTIKVRESLLEQGEIIDPFAKEA